MLLALATAAGQTIHEDMLNFAVRLSIPAYAVSSSGKTTMRPSPIGSAMLFFDSRSLFVITARHVVKDEDTVLVELPLLSGRMLLDTVTQAGLHFIFPSDTTLDLAMSALPPPSIPLESLNIMVIRESDMQDPDSAWPGQHVYALGFPLGLAGARGLPIVKAGVISMLPHGEPTFYIDAALYPGNSGGPVLTEPTFYRRTAPRKVEMQNVDQGLRVIGIAVNYIPWVDVAVSRQTHRPRVTFEENSGITEVVSARTLLDFVHNKR